MVIFWSSCIGVWTTFKINLYAARIRVCILLKLIVWLLTTEQPTLILLFEASVKRIILNWYVLINSEKACLRLNWGISLFIVLCKNWWCALKIGVETCLYRYILWRYKRGGISVRAYHYDQIRHWLKSYILSSRNSILLTE